MSDRSRALLVAQRRGSDTCSHAGREDLTRVAFERSVTGMLLISGRGPGQRVVEANLAAAQSLGTTIDRLRVGPWTSLLAEADRRLVDRATSSLLSGAIPGWQHEARVEGPRHTWVRIDLSLGGRVDGRPTVLVQLRDRTAEREARQELAQERHFVETMLDTPACLVVVTDLAGTVREFNEAAQRLTGRHLDEVVGRPLWESVVAPERREALRRCFATGRFLSGRGSELDEWVTHDGRRCTLAWVQTLVGLGTTHPRVVLTGVDLTHHRVAEGLLTAILGATTGSSIIATDNEGIISFVNPGAERMLGYASAELVGRLATVVHNREQLTRRAQEAGARPGLFALQLEEGPEGRRDWDYLRKDGTRLTVSLVVTAMRDHGGQVTGYLGVAEDVTEARQAERRRERALATERAAVRRLNELDRLKGDLVTTVSHELRTPLTSVLGYLELVRDGSMGDLSDLQDSMLGRVQVNADRLMSIVDNLLILSGADSQGTMLEHTRVDLGEVVRGALDLVVVPTTGHHVDFSAPAVPVVVLGDHLRLQQVVANLVSNAVKFSPGGHPVEVSLTAVGTTCRLMVSDHGVGIAKGEQAEVFTRFFRSPSTRDHAIPGAGLGLSVVQAVVEAHGGSVEVSSTPGRGSCFTVLLPRVAP